MKIKIKKVAEKMIGFRVSTETYLKLEKIASREKCAVSTVVREVIEQIIDTLE